MMDDLETNSAEADPYDFSKVLLEKENENV